ncbi:MAG: DUF2341 domain-containing protein [Armatimonadota bacterium]
MRYLAWVWLLLLMAGVCRAAEAPWQLPEWRYRMPLRVYNATGSPKSGLLLGMNDLPFTTLLSQGKLARDGRDLRLLDSAGNVLPLRAEHLDSDNGDSRFSFFLNSVAPRGKTRLWLYYGNPKAEPGPQLRADERAPLLSPETPIGCGAEEAKTPQPAAKAENLAAALANHRLVELESLDKMPGFRLLKGDADRISAGAYFGADGSPKRERSVELEAPAGELTCWVRYCPSWDARNAPRGTLTLSIEQNGVELAAESITLDLAEEQPPEPEYIDGGLAEDPEALVLAEEALQRERTAFRWAPLKVKTAAGKVTLTVASDRTRAGLDCAVLTADPAYLPDVRDFIGRVWVRWRVEQPAEYPHTVYLNNQIQPFSPHGPIYLPTGTVGRYGVINDTFDGRRKGVEVPVDAYEALPTGQFSPWVLLPTSPHYTWHSRFQSKVQGLKTAGPGTVRMEFANRPDPSRVFHVTPDEPIDLGGLFLVRMPTDTTIAGLQKLETFHEWALRRLQIAKDLNLGPPPRLQRLRVGTSAALQGNLPKEWAEIDFTIFDLMGLNELNVTGVSRELYAELAKAHGGIDVKSYARSENYNPSEKRSYELSITTHFDLGDEPGPVLQPRFMVENPEQLALFRDWLKKQGLTPELLGVTRWEDVYPTEDRRFVGGPKPPPPPKVSRDEWENPAPTEPSMPGDEPEVFQGEKKEYPGPAWNTLEAGRLYYYTWRFIDDYSTDYWRQRKENVLRHFPNAKLISPNYQAGPMQIAFLGNNNDTYRGMMDIFAYTRGGATRGISIEDWVTGADYGVVRENLACEMIRSATRKVGGGKGALLVGGEGIRGELYGYIMHGLQYVHIYYYGPVQNIGPAWGESAKAHKELSQSTRELKKFEDPIADGTLRPRKAALLVAYTSDLMQKHGTYFTRLRQSTYAGLKHGYTQTDVVCEQEILEDDILKQYDRLFITDSNAGAAVQRKIAEWVRNGGKLWACAGALEWDEFQQYCPVLDPVFGVKRREMVKAEPTVITADSPLFGGKVELPTTDQILAAEPDTAQVIGTYADGTPAIFYNKYGKGEALLIGALVGNVYQQQHYAEGSIKTPGGTYEGGADAQRLLNAFTSDADRPVVCSVPGILTTVLDSPQGSVVFLNNATYSAKPVEDRPAPTVTVRVQVTGKVASVESAKHGKLAFEMKDGVLTVTLPVPNADILMVRK